MMSLPAPVFAMTVALQAAKQFQAEPTRTGKERLGGKASDEQRVDNCKVPQELRGPKPRADDCPDVTTAAPAR